MQETATPLASPPVIQWRNTLKYLSYGLFVASIAAVIILFILSWLIQRNTDTITKNIATLDQKIQTISADHNIVIAKIIQDNGIRPSIDLKNIVTQFRVAAIKSNVAFEGFNIKDDIISTTLISTQGTDIHPDAVATIIRMMNEYAHSNQAFHLGKITNVSGDPTKRSTTIELTVTNTPIQ